LGEGTPITVNLSEGSGVNNIQFTFKYDPQLLEINTVNLNDSLAGLGWTNSSTIDPLTGTVSVQVQGTALGEGATDIINLSATTKTGAIYNSSGLLSVNDPLLNGGAIVAKGDTSLQQTTLFGDVSGNGENGSFDATLVTLASGSTQANTGFDALSLIDPNIIGDLTGNGALGSDDATIVAKKAVGLA
jgi:hypothetical protein